MKVVGYKSFFKDHKSIDGKIYNVGQIYHQEGPIIFGKQGFHLCTNIEDTFMYSNKMDKLEIAIVSAWGDLVHTDDEYRGCYDMYAASDMKIHRFLSREEIIKKALTLNQYSLIKILMNFPLTSEELKLFEGKDFFTDLIIDYYQKGIKKAFTADYKIKKMKI